MKTKADKVKEQVKALALEELESNAYDMQDDCSNEDIAVLCSHIASRALWWWSVTRHNEKDDRPHDYYLPNTEGQNYAVRISNTKGGSWLSISDDESTAVSRSLSYIINPADIDQYEVASLISCINEAWYTLKNE